jgi:hypothetical protein
VSTMHGDQDRFIRNAAPAPSVGSTTGQCGCEEDWRRQLYDAARGRTEAALRLPSRSMLVAEVLQRQHR